MFPDHGKYHSIHLSTIKYIQNPTFLLMNLRLVTRATPSITISNPQTPLIINLWIVLSLSQLLTVIHTKLINIHACNLSE